MSNVTITQINSPGKFARQRFARHKVALASAFLLATLLVLAVLLPILFGMHPNRVDATAIRESPSADHLLGTDSAGRDVLARLLVGGRVSLLVGGTAALIATTIGLILGTIAGYSGGWLDAVISRCTDVVLSFPTLVVIIVIVAFVGPSIVTLVLSIGLFGWPTAFRVVRGLTLSLRERDSVLAARSCGASKAWILRRHILPMVVAPLTVVATLEVATAILLEAALSFLGLGVPPPTASWGNMLNEAQSLTALETMPWLWIPAGAAIGLTVLAVNFVGDGLREAADPRSVV